MNHPRPISRPLIPFAILNLLLAGPGPAFSQADRALSDDTLATVGTHTITGRDLFERIELMPWQGKENISTHDSAKVKALQSMVAERLLAAEAESKGVGNDSLTLLRRNMIEHAFLRDELYKREIAAKVTIAPEEINAGMKKFSWTVRARACVFRSEASARKAEHALLHQTNPDSILLKDFRSDLLSADTATVNFGSVDPALEDAAYALSLEQPFSPATQSSYFGWVILTLIDGSTNPDYAKKSTADQLRTVERIVRTRKEQQRGNAYFYDLLGAQRAEADPETFALLAKAMHSRILADTVSHRKPNGYFIGGDEMDILERQLHASLGKVLVHLPGGGLTLGQALESFRVQEFIYPSLDLRKFRVALSNALRVLIQGEFFARQGIKEHLDRSEHVRHDTQVWSDYWLSQMFLADFPDPDPPTDEETIQALIRYGMGPAHHYEVNVREILADSLTTALRTLEKLLSGTDMAELARQISKRPGWPDHGGESGFFKVSESPILGYRALAADTGKIIGPVKLREGYSVFKVLGKRDLPVDSGLTFDSLRTTIRQSLRAKHRQEALNKFVATLAEKSGVKFHYENLKKVDIPTANMFTRRFIGFGGVMTAVPILFPQWQWIGEFHGGNSPLP